MKTIYRSCLLLLTILLASNVQTSGQSSGALSGRIIYTSGGHGWTNINNTWKLQRPLTHEMIEDYGNHDQATLFAQYCFNAGATVVPLRPIGHQTNEVVLDNQSAGVSFTGTWQTITGEPVYFGSLGSGFRQAAASSIETALALYTPSIPLAGFYPVYTWVPHGANRTNQLYRIRHTGGEAEVRIPHQKVGNGWVYLGTYHFQNGSNPASGAVAISNLQPSPHANSVVIADAIRFGNGMSPSGSGQPREEEAARYWIQYSLGQGQSSDIYLANSESAGDADRTSRPKMIREMNREQAGTTTSRVYISFHSNAFDGNARGGLALYHSTNATPNQLTLSSLCGSELNNDMFAMSAQLESIWFRRPTPNLGGIYYEIDNSLIGGEMDATVIEVAFHDNLSDARILRDPKGRTWIARSAYHAVVKYMNQFDGGSLEFLPEPPSNLRAIANAAGEVELAWNTPPAPNAAGWGTATGYRVYVSTDGYGFGNPVEISGGTSTNFTFSSLSPETDYYFRVTATNAGGESFPSEVAGCRVAGNPAQAKALFVNGFQRIDRLTNLRQDAVVPAYVRPGNSGAFERVVPRWNNSFDYVVQHGKALSASGVPFDSCHREAVANGLVNLTNYLMVVWNSGQELRTNFNSAIQGKITAYLAQHGNFFLSGSEIAHDLDRSAGPSTSDRAFFNNTLRADLTTDSHTNSGNYAVTPLAGSIFEGNAAVTIDNGTHGIYWVKSPEILSPASGSISSLSYSGNPSQGAGLQYDGRPANGRLVYLGFPFETIVSPASRTEYMSDVVRFLGAPFIRQQPLSTNLSAGSAFTLSAIAQGIHQLSYQWQQNGTNIAGATDATFTRLNATMADAGDYQVIVSSSSGSVTSAVAQVSITGPAQSGNFGGISVTNGAFHFTFAGEANGSYVIQTSTNLVNWMHVTNVILSNGAVTLSSPLNEHQQFFRGLLQE